MIRSNRAITILLLTGLLLSGCAGYSLSRGIYEGRQAQEQAIKDTPRGNPNGISMSYDDYLKARQALHARDAAQPN